MLNESQTILDRETNERLRNDIRETHNPPEESHQPE